MPFITLTAADGRTVSAYEARPAGQPRGGVVVMQEIFGVNAHIRSVADGFAQAGYLAIAPAAFGRLQPDVELGYADADMAAGQALMQGLQEANAHTHAQWEAR